jgi:hypothetical protein
MSSSPASTARTPIETPQVAATPGFSLVVAASETTSFLEGISEIVYSSCSTFYQNGTGLVGIVAG